MGCVATKQREPAEDQLSELLTPSQIQLIQGTWELLSDDMETTGTIIFSRFFQTDRDVKRLFQRLATRDYSSPEDSTIDETQLSKHAYVVMEALGAAVESIEDSALLSELLVALGRVHAEHKVKEHLLPRLWPAVRYALKEVLQDVFTEEVEETWKTVFFFIITKMRDGLKRERNHEGSTLVLRSRQNSVLEAPSDAK